jgi:hypothetical protein
MAQHAHKSIAFNFGAAISAIFVFSKKKQQFTEMSLV